MVYYRFLVINRQTYCSTEKIPPYHSIKLEIFFLNFSNNTLNISVSMNTCHGKRVAPWVCATMLIFASLQLSGKSVSKFCPFGITVFADQIIPKWCIFSFWAILEAIRWDKQPEKPTILVEGVNNTQQKFVWTYVAETSEFIRSVKFQRQRVVADPPVDIAGNTDGGVFTVFSPFISNYTASLPATLTLRNPVTNDDEFIYSIQISFLRNKQPTQGFSDRVQLIVYGK